jgi:hypothetical protein
MGDPGIIRINQGSKAGGNACVKCTLGSEIMMKSDWLTIADGLSSKLKKALCRVGIVSRQDSNTQEDSVRICGGTMFNNVSG